MIIATHSAPIWSVAAVTLLASDKPESGRSMLFRLDG